MILRSLSVQSYRNLADGTCSFHPATNLFLGDNGQGKTNLLEAIYYLATTRSFRTSSTASLVRIGSERLFVQGKVLAEGLERSLSIGMELAPQRRRELLLNEQSVSLRRYVGIIPLFAYSAARLEILRGGPDERRRFLDRGIASIAPLYLEHLGRYQKALKQRNSLLLRIREGRTSVSALDAWDEELVASAVPVVTARRDYSEALAASFNRIVEAHQYHVRGLVVRYVPAGIEGSPGDRERLARERSREIGLGHTVIGPHRDEVELLFRERPAAEILSSGEIKMTVLFLKFSKMDLYRSRSTDPPIFLLDDLDAELDLGIIERLFLFLQGTTQMFTTSAKEQFFERLPIGPHRSFRLRNGVVEESETRARA